MQTQIDSSSTERANLRRRVDTELLTISLSPPILDYAAQRTPVRDSLGEFGSMFREAIGQVITFLAFLLPWLVIIVPGLFLLRLFWRWMGRWLNRRGRRPGSRLIRSVRGTASLIAPLWNRPLRRRKQPVLTPRLLHWPAPFSTTLFGSTVSSLSRCATSGGILS